jgi:hypothetical protein
MGGLPHDSRLRNAEKIWEMESAIEGFRVPLFLEYLIHAAYKCYVFVEPAQLNPNGIAIE